MIYSIVKLLTTDFVLIVHVDSLYKKYFQIQHQYCLTDEIGPAHKKIFTVTLRLGDNEEEYSASGASIKKAQHSAAALALEKTKFKHPPPKTQRQSKQS